MTEREEKVLTKQQVVCCFCNNAWEDMVLMVRSHELLRDENQQLREAKDQDNNLMDGMLAECKKLHAENHALTSQRDPLRRAVGKAVNELVAHHCIVGTFGKELPPHLQTALNALQAALALGGEGVK